MNHIEGSGKSGAVVSADTATVWTVEDGLVTRMALYWDVDGAANRPKASLTVALVVQVCDRTPVVVGQRAARADSSGTSPGPVLFA